MGKRCPYWSPSRCTTAVEYTISDVSGRGIRKTNHQLTPGNVNTESKCQGSTVGECMRGRQGNHICTDEICPSDWNESFRMFYYYVSWTRGSQMSDWPRPLCKSIYLLRLCSIFTFPKNIRNVTNPLSFLIDSILLNPFKTAPSSWSLKRKTYTRRSRRKVSYVRREDLWWVNKVVKWNVYKESIKLRIRLI